MKSKPELTVSGVVFVALVLVFAVWTATKCTGANSDTEFIMIGDALVIGEVEAE